MPVYALRCDKCGASSDRFAYMSEFDAMRSDCCKATMSVDWSRTPPPKKAREWDGQEATSLALRFDPKAIGDIKKDCPSIELNADGNVVFKSDAHQRRVYREMESAKRRYEAERQKADEQFWSTNPTAVALKAEEREIKRKCSEMQERIQAVGIQQE